MVKAKGLKVNFETTGGISRTFAEEPERLKVEKVYRAQNGLLKVDQKHDTRFNLVLPAQLYRAFEEVAEREVGKRERTSVIEHLMIEYCRENGVEIVEKEV